MWRVSFVTLYHSAARICGGFCRRRRRRRCRRHRMAVFRRQSSCAALTHIFCLVHVVVAVEKESEPRAICFQDIFVHTLCSILNVHTRAHIAHLATAEQATETPSSRRRRRRRTLCASLQPLQYFIVAIALLVFVVLLALRCSSIVAAHSCARR